MRIRPPLFLPTARLNLCWLQLFLGTFEDWLFKTLGGIQSTSPGSETVTIAPFLSSPLTSVSAWMLTPFGNLTVQWEKKGNPAHTDIVLGIPVGITATFLPGKTTKNQVRIAYRDSRCGPVNNFLDDNVWFWNT